MSDDLKSLDELSTLTSGEDAIVEVAAPREPVRDSLGRSYATGKRKDAVARVWIKRGNGKITVNGKDQEQYFARPVLRMLLQQPLETAERKDEFDIVATVVGGRRARRLAVIVAVSGGGSADRAADASRVGPSVVGI